LGGGAFTYEGVQSPESQYLTLWRMTLGGAVMGNDEQAPGETVTLAYGLTAPRRMAITSEFVQRLRSMRTVKAA
jgi:hypothetical protein